MVELSGKSDPYQHSFPNIVFILPAIITLGLMGKLMSSLVDENTIVGEENITKTAKGSLNVREIPEIPTTFFSTFCCDEKKELPRMLQRFHFYQLANFINFSDQQQLIIHATSSMFLTASCPLSKRLFDLIFLIS